MDGDEAVVRIASGATEEDDVELFNHTKDFAFGDELDIIARARPDVVAHISSNALATFASVGQPTLSFGSQVLFGDDADDALTSSPPPGPAALEPSPQAKVIAPPAPSEAITPFGETAESVGAHPRETSTSVVNDQLFVGSDDTEQSQVDRIAEQILRDMPTSWLALLRTFDIATVPTLSVEHRMRRTLNRLKRQSVGIASGIRLGMQCLLSYLASK